MYKKSAMLAGGCAIVLGLGFLAVRSEPSVYADGASESEDAHAAPSVRNAWKMISEGRQTFRFDTFGDEAFWGDTLKRHQAVEGVKFGGVGPGLSPRNALALGLKKMDIDALSGGAGNQLPRAETERHSSAAVWQSAR
jgi:hypothetical protein